MPKTTKTTKRTTTTNKPAAPPKAAPGGSVANLCAANGLSSYWHKPVAERS